MTYTGSVCGTREGKVRGADDSAALLSPRELAVCEVSYVHESHGTNDTDQQRDSDPRDRPARSRDPESAAGIGVLCEKHRRGTEAPLPMDVRLGAHVPDRDVIPHDLGGYDAKR
jgi:hypothetical protein